MSRELEEDVMEMMRLGMAPSAIDRAFFLDEGTAHDAVVGKWARDTEEHRKSKRLPEELEEALCES